MAGEFRILKPTSDRHGLRLLVHRLGKDFLCGWLYPHIYRRNSHKPVNPRKVLFVESKLREMPDAFTLVWNQLESSGDYDLQYFPLGATHVSFIQYTRNCAALVREMGDAAYVFLCDANDIVSSVPLRSETKVAQLWHACGAFKKWGMSTADKKFGATRKGILRHPYYKNLSLVTISAPDVAWAYTEAMHLEDTPEVVKPLGVSRTDVFFDKDFIASAQDAVRDALPAIAGRKIILYAPTFRGHVRGAKGPDELDIAAMRAALGDEYALVIKHHPYVKTPPAIPAGCEDFAFDVTHAGLPIDKLLTSADACITDYSSIVFEYSLFGRPICFFAPDIADYNDWRGFYYDYDELTPGPVFSETEPLIAWMEGLAAGFDSAEVDAFRERFMGSCDGKSTARILEYLGISA